MCFTGDYGDGFQVNFEQKERGRSCRDLACDECYATIPAGTVHLRRWQSAAPWCAECGRWGVDSEVCGEPCDDRLGGDWYFGPVCGACEILLAAVEAVEADEGCEPGVRLPPPGWLGEEWDYLDDDAVRAYAVEAIRREPLMRLHRIVARTLRDWAEDHVERLGDADAQIPPPPEDPAGWGPRRQAPARSLFPVMDFETRRRRASLCLA